MADIREVTFRPIWNRGLWVLVGLGAAGASVAAVRMAYWGEFVDVWVGVGLLLALMGIACLYAGTAEVSADAYGLRSRTLLRRRSVPWRDVADLRVYLQYGRHHEVYRRVSLVRRNGRERRLPLPWSSSDDDPDFDAKLDVLRAMHRRYGAPESRHVPTAPVPVISNRTAGRGRAGSLALCVLLLVGAGGVAWSVLAVASHERAWKSATPCTAGTPAAERRECLTTLPAVIARTEVNGTKVSSWLYFADSRPLERVGVSREDAQVFRPGDSVELTVWRGTVMEVAGERHVWHEHVSTPGSQAVLAAVLGLAAGYPGARVLIHLRGRRRPDDEVLPSALPFVGTLAGTALWLLPLCYLHPTTLFDSPVTITWATVGSSASLGMLAWAWRDTRIRTPGEAAATEESKGSDATEGFDGSDESERFAEKEQEVFLAARFLDHTDYNPYGFGTHVVLGGGPPAVTPHPGPGRFAAKRMPVERLAVKAVRRVRGSDGENVSSAWHIAELDDAGETVRLAAAPDDLARIIRELARQSA
ncbi:PH domain-containing protein [Streptomyces sp. NPDC002845]